MSPTRADLVALLSDVEAYLAPRSEASEADRPNEAMRLLASVSDAREALEKAAKFCEWCVAGARLIQASDTRWYHIVQAVAPPGAAALVYDTHKPCTAVDKANDESPTEALIRWLDENVSRRSHGSIGVTCLRCIVDYGGLR